MKLISTITLSLFCSIVSQAQTFKGVVKNAETQQPVSQITIVNEDQSFFTTSNEQGEVVLPDTVLNQKLFIDDYEYVYSEKTFTNTQPFVWEVQPNSETLEEIVIYENGSKILEEIIKNSIKSFSKNTKLESFYRENYIENNQIASFAEGIVDFYMGDKIDMVAKQSHVEDFAEVDDFNRSSVSSPAEIVEASMRFNALLDMLKDKNKYEFYVTAKQVGNKTIHTCYISPLEKSKKRFLMKAFFVFDEAKKLILETNYAFDPEKKQYNSTINVVITKIDINDVHFKSKYMVTDYLYYPSYAKFSKEAIVNSKLAKVKNAKINNESFFYAISATKTNEKPAEERIFKLKSLYSSGNKYSKEFWNDPEIKNLMQ